MSFPEPYLGPGPPWQEVMSRRVDSSRPSRPPSPQSAISNFSDGSLDSTLLQSDLISDAQSRRDASATANQAAGTQGRPAQMSEWMKIVVLLCLTNLIQFIYHKWNVSLAALATARVGGVQLFEFVSHRVFSTIGGAITNFLLEHFKSLCLSFTQSIPALKHGLTRGTSMAQRVSIDLSIRLADWVKHASFLLIASFGVASSFVLKAIYQIPRRLRWASLLFCFAAAIIAAQPDKGTGLLTMARDSASRLPQNASHLGRTILYPVDNAYPEVTIQDVSAEPQAVVLQQRNELSNALQLSMPNNEMSINLLASSDAFRSLAR